MDIHNLKVTENNWPKYLKRESWSIRNNDRGFKVDDVCCFTLVKSKDTLQMERQGMTRFSKEKVLKQITGVVYHKDFPEGIKEGYCVLDLHTLAKTIPPKETKC